MKKRPLDIEDVRDDSSLIKMNPLQIAYLAYAVVYLRWSIVCGTLRSEKTVTLMTIGAFIFSVFILIYNHKYEERKSAKVICYGSLSICLTGFAFFIYAIFIKS